MEVFEDDDRGTTGGIFLNGPNSIRTIIYTL